MTPKQLAFEEMRATGINPIPEKQKGLQPLYMGFQEMCTIGFELDLNKIQYRFTEFPYSAKIILSNGQELMLLKYLTRSKNVYKYFVNRSAKNKFSDGLFVGTYNAKHDEFLLSPVFTSALKSFINPLTSMKSVIDFVKEVRENRQTELFEIVKAGVTPEVPSETISLPRKRLQNA